MIPGYVFIGDYSTTRISYAAYPLSNPKSSTFRSTKALFHIFPCSTLHFSHQGGELCQLRSLYEQIPKLLYFTLVSRSKRLMQNHSALKHTLCHANISCVTYLPGWAWVGVVGSCIHKSMTFGSAKFISTLQTGEMTIIKLCGIPWHSYPQRKGQKY